MAAVCGFCSDRIIVRPLSFLSPFDPTVFCCAVVLFRADGSSTTIFLPFPPFISRCTHRRFPLSNSVADNNG